jgi:hypothetical protein
VSPDERRIANWLRGVAATYDKRAQQRPFSFDRVRAKLALALAVAIEEGRHR